jgi:hypothetical protein
MMTVSAAAFFQKGGDFEFCFRSRDLGDRIGSNTKSLNGIDIDRPAIPIYLVGAKTSCILASLQCL